ncbi:hypothetical protein [Botryobacter ruber]|uniref:hypothetical protein n=1 Tax=Botryobacter ruber TaxID=2171629 RepID=UPI000E0BE63B|nr:hypothetical protein [Botryobacter ruber]
MGLKVGIANQVHPFASPILRHYNMKQLENDLFRARIYKNDARLYVEWLRSVSPEEFREGVEQLVKLMLEEEIELWIVDSSRLHGITLSDQHWILHHILPLLQNAKLRKLARVSSGDIFQYMSFEEMTEKVLRKYEMNVEVAQFTSLAMAEAWISIKD